MGILDSYDYVPTGISSWPEDEGISDYVPTGISNWPEDEGISKYESKGIPLLMVPGDSPPNYSSHPIFINIFTAYTDLTYSLPPPSTTTKCCGSSHGWLIMSNHQCHALQNPLTDYEIQLPPLSDVIHKAILTSDPSDGNSTTVIIIFGKDRRLAFARRGDESWDESWTVISDAGGLFQDVIYHNERFLAVDDCGRVVQVDLLDSCPKPHMTKITDPWYRGSGKVYLAGIPYGLCVVIRSIDETSGLTEKFDVYDLDFGDRKWERVGDLSGRMLFLGQNHSVALPTCPETESVKNCIHFTDDSLGGTGRDMGIFMMSDESIVRVPGRASKSSSLRPTWFLKEDEDSNHQEE